MADITNIDTDSATTSAFIDLWGQFPCLWDVKDPTYRNKISRHAALKKISDTFGQGWTTAAEKRKINSLKTYYLKVRKVVLGKTGMSGGIKRLWEHYHQINGFLGSTQYDGSTVTASQCPGDHPEDEFDTEDFDSATDIAELNRSVREECSWSQASGSSTSISMALDVECITLPEPHTSMRPTPGCSPSTTVDLTSSPSNPPPKRPRVVLDRKRPVPAGDDSPKAGVIEEARGLIQSIKDARRDKEDEDYHFAMNMMKELKMIKSERRRLQIKHDIENLVFHARMQEMDD